MGTANGIRVECAELADTLDIQPRFSDVVVIFQFGCEYADTVAQAWLQHLEEG